MFRRFMSVAALVAFMFNTVAGQNLAYAQSALALPEPGAMVGLSPASAPVIMKGLKVHADNPLLFDFIIDTGKTGLSSGSPAFRSESEKLIKYFLASLTIREDDLWVNLSPYEKDRMIVDELGQTELGRDMLAQDYILKQLTASLIYPEKELGKKFWDSVYAKAQAKFGTSDIPVDTFNKVWIVADKAEVYEKNDTAYITDAHLKVMLESDYLAANKGDMDDSLSADQKAAQELGKGIVREVIIPELEREVNQGENFAPLRQMFYSMVLASWYKMSLKDALLNQVYSDKAKTNGVKTDDPAIKEKIYAQYLEAYKKGVFNYVKEDVDPATRETIPHKYFSGGLKIDAAQAIHRISALPVDRAELPTTLVNVQANMASADNPDAAMLISKDEEPQVLHGSMLDRYVEREGRNLPNAVRARVWNSDQVKFFGSFETRAGNVEKDWVFGKVTGWIADSGIVYIGHYSDQNKFVVSMLDSRTGKMTQTLRNPPGWVLKAFGIGLDAAMGHVTRQALEAMQRAIRTKGFMLHSGMETNPSVPLMEGYKLRQGLIESDVFKRLMDEFLQSTGVQQQIGWEASAGAGVSLRAKVHGIEDELLRVHGLFPEWLKTRLAGMPSDVATDAAMGDKIMTVGFMQPWTRQLMDRYFMERVPADFKLKYKWDGPDGWIVQLPAGKGVASGDGASENVELRNIVAVWFQGGTLYLRQNRGVPAYFYALRKTGGFQSVGFDDMPRSDVWNSFLVQEIEQGPTARSGASTSDSGRGVLQRLAGIFTGKGFFDLAMTTPQASSTPDGAMLISKNEEPQVLHGNMLDRYVEREGRNLPNAVRARVWNSDQVRFYGSFETQAGNTEKDWVFGKVTGWITDAGTVYIGHYSDQNKFVVSMLNSRTGKMTQALRNPPARVLKAFGIGLDAAMTVRATYDEGVIDQLVRNLPEAISVKENVRAYLNGGDPLAALDALRVMGKSDLDAQWLLDAAWLTAAHNLNDQDFRFLRSNLNDFDGRDRKKILYFQEGTAVKDSDQRDAIVRDGGFLWERWQLLRRIQTKGAALANVDPLTTVGMPEFKALRTLHESLRLVNMKLSPLPIAGELVAPSDYRKEVVNAVIEMARDSFGLVNSDKQEVLRKFITQGGDLEAVSKQFSFIMGGLATEPKPILIGLLFFAQHLNHYGRNDYARAYREHLAIISYLVGYERSLLKEKASFPWADRQETVGEMFREQWVENRAQAQAILSWAEDVFNGYWYPLDLNAWGAVESDKVKQAADKLADSVNLRTIDGKENLQEYLAGLRQSGRGSTMEQWALDSAWLWAKYNLNPARLPYFTSMGVVQNIEHPYYADEMQKSGLALNKFGAMSRDAQLLWERWQLLGRIGYANRQMDRDPQADVRQLRQDISAMRKKIYLLRQQLSDAAMGSSALLNRVVADIDADPTGIGKPISVAMLANIKARLDLLGAQQVDTNNQARFEALKKIVTETYAAYGRAVRQVNDQLEKEKRTGKRYKVLTEKNLGAIAQSVQDPRLTDDFSINVFDAAMTAEVLPNPFVNQISWPVTDEVEYAGAANFGFIASRTIWTVQDGRRRKTKWAVRLHDGIAISLLYSERDNRGPVGMAGIASIALRLPAATQQNLRALKYIVDQLSRDKELTETLLNSKPYDFYIPTGSNENERPEIEARLLERANYYRQKYLDNFAAKRKTDAAMAVQDDVARIESYILRARALAEDTLHKPAYLQNAIQRNLLLAQTQLKSVTAPAAVQLSKLLTAEAVSGAGETWNKILTLLSELKIAAVALNPAEQEITVAFDKVPDALNAAPYGYETEMGVGVHYIRLFYNDMPIGGHALFNAGEGASSVRGEPLEQGWKQFVQINQIAFKPDTTLAMVVEKGEVRIMGPDIPNMKSPFDSAQAQALTQWGDAAMKNPGGIELNANKMGMTVNRDGSGIQMKFDPAMVEQFRKGDFTGIVPVIINMTPIVNPAAVLGMADNNPTASS